MQTYDFGDLDIPDFVPEKRTSLDCKHANKTFVMEGRDIKYRKCHDCGEVVA